MSKNNFFKRQDIKDEAAEFSARSFFAEPNDQDCMDWKVQQLIKRVTRCRKNHAAFKELEQRIFN